MKVLSIILVGCWVSALSACGQKGDLYLPKIPPAPNVVSETDTTSSAQNGLPTQEEAQKKTDSLPASDSK